MAGESEGRRDGDGQGLRGCVVSSGRTETAVEVTAIRQSEVAEGGTDVRRVMD